MTTDLSASAWPMPARTVARVLYAYRSGNLLLRYGFVITLVAAALLLTLGLQHVEAGRPTLFLFFAAIVTSAWIGGAGPGSFAVCLAIPAGLYFYAESVDSFRFHVDNFVLLALFVLCAMLGGMLNAWQNRADHALAQKAAQLQNANAILMAEMADRRRAEQALRDTQAELARVSRLTMMGELAASIAHEINQPLAAIANSAGACMRWLNADPPNLAEARQSAACITRDSGRAAEVMRRIRHLVCKQLSQKTGLEPNRAIADVLALLQADFDASGIQVKCHLDQGLPFLMGDRVQLQQLFLNILMNAADALSRTDGQQRRIVIRSRPADNGAEIVFEDNGTGLGDDTDKIFEPFYSTKQNGMGLGLSICRSIAEAHGGRLWAEPASPNGARFFLFLPTNGDA